MGKLNFQKIKTEVAQNMKLSAPLVVSQLLYASTGFLGTLMLAHLGENVLAATVVISMLWAALSVTFFGMLGAVSVLVSHQHGAQNTQGVRHIMGQALLLATLLTIMISLLLTSAPYFLRFTHLPVEVIKLAKQYLSAIRLWVPALTFMIVLEQFLIGLGKTRVVMWTSLLLVPLQVLFIHCFISGAWFFPAVGIASVGYGISLADTLGLIFLIVYLLMGKSFKEYRLFSNIKLNGIYLKELIKVGLPMGIMSFIEVGAFTIMTYAIAYFGTMPLAAHQIVFQFLGLMITIVFAMSQAVTVRVGHAVGALDREGVRYAIAVGMGLNVCIMLGLALMLSLFPHWLIGLDLNLHDEKNDPLIQEVTVLLHIVAFFMVFDNFRIIGFGALRGIKDANFPMISSFIAFWVVGLSLSVVFGFLLNAQAAGIWIGMTAGIFSGALIVLWRINHKIKSIDLTEIRAIG